MNNKLLIVGSFPTKENKIFGGISKSCEILLNNKNFNAFEIIKFDSSQISHPPPKLYVRSILALYRLLRFILQLIVKKPHGVLIFCADGGSAVEKGIMVLFTKLLNIKAYIFPRAGNLITQVSKSNLMLIIIQFLFTKADIFFCQGERWVEFASRKLKIKSSKIQVINNWSATSDIINIGKKRKISSSKAITRLIYIGWLEKEKGIIELLNSFFQLIKSEHNLELILIGDGSLRNYIKSFKIKNKLNDKILQKGWLDSSKIKYYLAKADIFVLPSWQEGMPNALIEALASGLPSITTSVGVIPDFLKNNISGLIIESKNSNILKKSIEKLINDNNLRKKLSKNGILVAQKNFETDKSLENFSKIILQTLN